MKFTTVRTVIALAASAALAAGCSSGGGSADEDADGGSKVIKIAVAVSPSAGTSTPMYLGVKKGFFKKRGLEVKLSTLTNGTVAIPQVMSGQNQFSMASFAPTLEAIKKGLPVKVVTTASIVSTSESKFQGFVVRDDYSSKTLADAKTIAWQSALIDPILADNVDKLGGDFKKMKVLQIPLPSAIDALLSGTADTTLMNQPFLGQAISTAGLKLLSYVGPEQSLPGTPMAFFIGSEKYLGSHPKVTKDFQDAVAESYAYAQANKQEVSNFVPETGLSDKPLPLEAMPEYATEEVKPARWDEMLQLFSKYGANPDDLTSADVLYSPK